MTDLSSQRKHLTTSQRLAAHDAKARAAAAATGVPTNRTVCQGLHLGGKLATVIHTGVDGKVYLLDMRVDSEPVRATFEAIRGAMWDAYDIGEKETKVHNVAMFADTDTLRRVAKMADAWSRDKQTQEAKRLSRLLAFRKGLPVSVYTPVLTEALATRYWLPSGPSTDDVAAWDAAFRHGHQTGTREAYSHLVARALDGASEKDTVAVITSAEKYGARSGQWGSDHSAASAYSKAGTITDAYTALLAVDPVLRERNAITGVVSKIRIHQVKDNKIEAFMDDPGKLREASKVLVFDGYEYGKKVEVTLRSVDFTNDHLMAILSPPSKRDPNAHIIEEAHKNYRPLYVVTAPFLMLKRTPQNRRWTEGGEAKTLHVDMPVDIALAGAPTGD